LRQACDIALKTKSVRDPKKNRLIQGQFIVMVMQGQRHDVAGSGDSCLPEESNNMDFGMVGDGRAIGSTPG
jgi:hypothetical protein